MAIEALDKKGTAYLQGIQGLNYLGKMSGFKKPMNILKSFLKSSGRRKDLYLKFNEGELDEVMKGVYQIKINPSDKNFLNDLRDELEDNGEDIDKITSISSKEIKEASSTSVDTDELRARCIVNGELNARLLIPA